MTEREVTTLRSPQPPVPAQFIRSVSLGGVDNCFLQANCSRSSQLCHSCYIDVGAKLQRAQAGFLATHWQVSGEIGVILKEQETSCYTHDNVLIKSKGNEYLHFATETSSYGHVLQFLL